MFVSIFSHCVQVPYWNRGHKGRIVGKFWCKSVFAAPALWSDAEVMAAL